MNVALCALLGTFVMNWFDLCTLDNGRLEFFWALKHVEFVKFMMFCLAEVLKLLVKCVNTFNHFECE